MYPAETVSLFPSPISGPFFQEPFNRSPGASAPKGFNWIFMNRDNLNPIPFDDPLDSIGWRKAEFSPYFRRNHGLPSGGNRASHTPSSMNYYFFDIAIQKSILVKP
jgi:hypothetical protein